MTVRARVVYAGQVERTERVVPGLHVVHVREAIEEGRRGVADAGTLVPGDRLPEPGARIGAAGRQAVRSLQRRRRAHEDDLFGARGRDFLEQPDEALGSIGEQVRFAVPGAVERERHRVRFGCDRHRQRRSEAIHRQIASGPEQIDHLAGAHALGVLDEEAPAPARPGARQTPGPVACRGRGRRTSARPTRAGRGPRRSSRRSVDSVRDDRSCARRRRPARSTTPGRNARRPGGASSGAPSATHHGRPATRRRPLAADAQHVLAGEEQRRPEHREHGDARNHLREQRVVEGRGDGVDEECARRGHRDPARSVARRRRTDTAGRRRPARAPGSRGRRSRRRAPTPPRATAAAIGTGGRRARRSRRRTPARAACRRRARRASRWRRPCRGRRRDRP